MQNRSFSFLNSSLLVFLLLLSACKPGVKKEQDHQFTNALVHETSPYLLQHAHNPVDWRPWSEEAFEEAKKEGKLVIISVGYSSCHWCHVMEEETFVDEEVAKVMNENFISIKVDREERPDIDQVYMTAVQLMTGNGGWPMNVVTLPNGKPIYGGTYHTKSQWTKMLSELNKLYREDPNKASEYADMVAKGIKEVNLIQLPESDERFSSSLLVESITTWKPLWDLEWGGTQGRQKFMMPDNLKFLLDYGELAKDESAIEFVKITLDKMALGGVYDQIGGGFFRYSTDRFWKVPHFEKMLYDSAQLLELYSFAYLKFKDPLYKQLVFETAAFLEREMRHPQGGYYTSLDADSEGEEGKFYIWSESELKELIGEDFQLFSAYFNVKEGERWEGSYILQRQLSDLQFASENKIAIETLQTKVQDWKKKLHEARNKRVFPGTDDKVITSWNALLISGLVQAYHAFGEEHFLEEAESIFSFLLKKSWKDGILLHSYKEGDTGARSFLEDYAFLGSAALKLYSATMNPSYLEFAKELSDQSIDDFTDAASGMFRYSRESDLITTIIKTDDGVLPSPNAVMAHNLFRLGHVLYDTELLDRSAKMLRSMAKPLKETPYNYSHWGQQYLREAFPYFEIAIVGQEAPRLIKELHANYLPNTLVVGTSSSSEDPLFKARYVEGQSFVYVCRNNACKLPVTSSEQALEQLKNF